MRVVGRGLAAEPSFVQSCVLDTQPSLNSMFVEPGFVYAVQLHVPAGYVDGPYYQMRLVDWENSSFFFEIQRKVRGRRPTMTLSRRGRERKQGQALVP